MNKTSKKEREGERYSIYRNGSFSLHFEQVRQTGGRETAAEHEINITHDMWGILQVGWCVIHEQCV